MKNDIGLESKTRRFEEQVSAKQLDLKKANKHIQR